MLKNNSVRRAAVTPALGVLVGGLLSLGVGTTASASEAGATGRPDGCNFTVSNSWGTEARCSSHNGGSYRAIAVCTDHETGKVQDFYGDWRQTGFSYAYCNGSYRATSSAIETSVRNYTR